ncbi:MAG: WYL domain-containing protein [Chitinophagaceae bacterium]|nr:WYL domain-containing protein [Chitinophagaceae bacterium]
MYNQNKILRVLQLISLLKKEPAKSIRFLSGILESTDRTVYRYLDLIKELGFELQRDQNNRFFIINDVEVEPYSFSNEEVVLLKELLLSVGKDSKLKDSILKKIYFKSEIAIHGNHILKAHLGKIVEKLSGAIQNEKRVILKDYHSANSQKISDRLVEPITFNDNYNSLIAFEVETGENKYFNIERISDIIELNTDQEFQEKHKNDKPDIFGFSELNGEKFEVQLRLTLRAYLILKEEYPLVHPHVKKEPNNETYLLKCNVNNPKAITRFILGFPKDVEIMGSEKFKTFIFITHKQ